MSKNSDPVRLNKFLAAAGEGSRRTCDVLIQQGRVEVNGQIIVNPGIRVSPTDHVRIDGRRVAVHDTIVLAFHKPRGLVCTRSDEHNRDTIYKALPPMLHSLHHTGRLDLESEGLLVLTNDGDLTQRLMHPRSGIEKEYLVTANQAFDHADLAKLTKGIYTADGKLVAKHAELLSPRRLKIILQHGAKRQIRVMFEALGYKVGRLLRVRIGSLWLGDLKPGEYATLTPAEIAMLLENPAPPAAKSTPAKGGKEAPKRLNRRATPKAKSAPPSKPAKKTPRKAAFKSARKPAGPAFPKSRATPRRNSR
ncbi:MAG: pseudouridine synthase [Luteolibacter sp.]